MTDLIKIARYRNTPYVFNFKHNGGTKVSTYEWAGSKKSKFDIKEIPIEAVSWLQMNSSCFKSGELVIIDDNEEAQHIVTNMGEDKESYVNNSHSKEDIINLLNGHAATMKSALEKINEASEKRFVIDIAKEMSEELSGGKLKFLAEWMDIPQDVLFGE